MLTRFKIGTKRGAVDFIAERVVGGFRYNEHCDILTNNLIQAMRDTITSSRAEANISQSQMDKAIEVAETAPQIVELEVSEKNGSVILCRIRIVNAEKAEGTVKALNNCRDFASTMKAYAEQYRDDSRSGKSPVKWLKSMIVEFIL